MLKSSRNLICAALALIAASAAAEEKAPAVAASALVGAPVDIAGVGQNWAPPSKYRISPQFALAVPQPLSVGAEIWKPEDTRLRPFANTGYVILPFSSGTRTIREFTTQAGARYFPWRKGFFGSASLGYRYLGFNVDTSTFTINGQKLATNGVIDLYTMFTGLSIGAEFPLSRKMTFGFDVGAQVPILAYGRLNLENNTNGQSSSNTDMLGVDNGAAITRIARLLLPQVTLFRLTWNLDP